MNNVKEILEAILKALYAGQYHELATRIDVAIKALGAVDPVFHNKIVCAIFTEGENDAE